MHPYKNRVLTVREAARLSGFPDWYRFPATISEAWEQIGNSVPPPLASGVFAQIRDQALAGRRPLWTERPTVAASRYVEKGSSFWTERRLRIVARRLSAEYNDPRHHNKSDPLDELVFIILSAKTAESSYVKTFDSLKARYPSWNSLLAAPSTEVESAIELGGLAHKKGSQILRLLWAIQQERGKLDLGFLSSWETGDAEEFLTTLPGVGRKSAKCVTMYSLGRASFPVDTHVRRVFVRLGVARITRLDDAAQDFIESMVPSDIRYKLHVNALALGRKVCVARDPSCEECPLNDLCDFAAARTHIRSPRTEITSGSVAPRPTDLPGDRATMPEHALARAS